MRTIQRVRKAGCLEDAGRHSWRVRCPSALSDGTKRAEGAKESDGGGRWLWAQRPSGPQLSGDWIWRGQARATRQLRLGTRRVNNAQQSAFWQQHARLLANASIDPAAHPRPLNTPPPSPSSSAHSSPPQHSTPNRSHSHNKLNLTTCLLVLTLLEVLAVPDPLAVEGVALAVDAA